MAASEVAICNRALDLVGQPAINALTEPGKAAALCLRNYALSRDTVLRSYPWNSATRRVALAALATAPAWGYARQFQIPSDCLRVLDSEGDLDGVKWRREGQLLLTDAGSPLRIRYIAQITDPGLFDAMLSDCIASHLAVQIAYALSGSGEVQARAAALHAQMMRDARGMDARESSQDEVLGGNTWTEARN